MHINHEVLMKCFGEVWGEYLAYCKKQQQEARQINIRLEKEYEKKWNATSKHLPPTAFAQYNPPIFHSIYDSPSFEGMMAWLSQQNAPKPKAKKRVLKNAKEQL